MSHSFCPGACCVASVISWLMLSVTALKHRMGWRGVRARERAREVQNERHLDQRSAPLHKHKVPGSIGSKSNIVLWVPSGSLWSLPSSSSLSLSLSRPLFSAEFLQASVSQSDISVAHLPLNLPITRQEINSLHKPEGRQHVIYHLGGHFCCEVELHWRCEIEKCMCVTSKALSLPKAQ